MVRAVSRRLWVISVLTRSSGTTEYSTHTDSSAPRGSRYAARTTNDWIAPHLSRGTNNTICRSVPGGTEVRRQHLTVADDVPFRQHGKSALGNSGCPDVVFFVRFETLRERPEELVGEDGTVVVRKPVITGLVYVEAVVAPDDEYAVVVQLPVQRPKQWFTQSWRTGSGSVTLEPPSGGYF